MKKAVHSGRMSAYPLHSKDKLVTEGKTTVRSIVKVIQKKKRLDSDITRPIYQYKYRFAIRESRFWCLMVFRKSIIKREQEEYVC